MWTYLLGFSFFVQFELLHSIGDVRGINNVISLEYGAEEYGAGLPTPNPHDDIFTNANTPQIASRSPAQIVTAN